MAKTDKRQLTLDMLFDKPTPEKPLPEKCIDWLVDIHGCPRERVAPRIKRLFTEFDRAAWDRAKAYPALCGKNAIPGYDETDDEWLGVFDRELDYHTVWDRVWAAGHGLEREEVSCLKVWDYTHKRPGSFIK